MIRSLEDAWRWYKAVQKLVAWMDRMAKRYWIEEVEELTLKETLSNLGCSRSSWDGEEQR